jgi:murein DD-endopeptidase MepM/ murein hydrolase activator NlpD
MRQSIAAFAVALTTLSGLGAQDWTWPIDNPAPQVVRNFHPPDEPWSAGHRGIDLVSDPGAAVRAAGAGTVSHAGLIAGVGVVAVSHGAVRTTYQPVAAHVSVGQRVEVGDVLGVLTSAGSHCAPDACLHWGLIEGGTYLDPLRLVTAAGPPRLLPLDDDALRPPAQPATAASPVSEGVRTNVGALAAAGAVAGIRNIAP